MSRQQRKPVLLVDNPIDLLGLIIGIVAIMAAGTLYANYYGNTTYPSLSADAFDLCLQGIFALAGMFGMVIFCKTKEGKNSPIVASQWDHETTTQVTYSVASYILIQAVILILRASFEFQIATVDVYMFFFAAAITEELLYRGFLVMLIQYVTVKLLGIKPSTDSDVLLPNLFATILSATSFALVHERYWSDPALMVITFLGGISQSYFYLKTKNIFVPMFAHAVINAAASGSEVQRLAQSTKILQKVGPIDVKTMTVIGVSGGL